MSSLKNLKNKLRGCKAQLSRIENFINNLDGTEEAHLLAVKLNSLIGYYENYRQIQSEIISLTEEEDSSEGTSEEDAYSDRFELNIAKLESCVDKFKHNSEASLDTSASNVSLPKINIKPFSGDASEWHSFFDLFSALVLNNSKLKSEGEKFYYLKSLLRNQPLQLIDSLSVTNQNLEVALTILKSTYDNQVTLLHTLYKTLVEQKSVTKSNPTELREFYITTKKTLDLIRNVGLTSEVNFESLIVFLLEQKLDFQSRKEFEGSRDSEKIPSCDDFFQFLKKRYTLLEGLNLFENNRSVKSLERPREKVNLFNKFDNPNSNHTSHANNSRSSNSNNYQAKTSCPCCSEQNHTLYKCRKFLSLKPQERYQLARSKGLCLNCLSSQHLFANCKSLKRCLSCNKQHHSFLHFESSQVGHSHEQHNNPSNVETRTNSRQQNNVNFESRNSVNRSNNNSSFVTVQPPETNNSPGNLVSPEDNVTSFSTMSFSRKIVLLPTALVNVFCADGRVIVARALLDSASQMSVVSSHLTRCLGINKQSRTVNIVGLGGKACTQSFDSIQISFGSQVYPEKTFTVSCAVIEKITDKLPQFSISTEKLKLPENVRIELADPTFFQPGKIDILIGADIYFNLLRNGNFSLGNDMPSLVNTHLGYVIAGPISPSRADRQSSENNFMLSFLSTQDESSNGTDNLSQLVEKFWEIEDMPQELGSSKMEDQIVENIFLSTTQVLPSGKFQVDMPLSTDKNKKLGQSFCMARQRFFALEKKFIQNSKFFESYRNVVAEYLTMNHAKVIPLNLMDRSGTEFKYFIPHRAVIREECTSTKLRVVMDFSAKTESGVALNDLTLKGYQVQPNLFDILCRFRYFRFVLCADIKMMYRMIDINPEQRYLQNILWRDDPSDSFKCIELSSLSFGQNCAPFLATRVLKEIAMRNPECSEAQNALLNQTYMDDILSGTNDYRNLDKLYIEINQVLNRHGFELHKWKSNSVSFLNKQSLVSKSELDLNLTDSGKILGLKWNSDSDTLNIKSSAVPTMPILTKRIILSILSSVYDPLGVINPLVVSGKLIMQKLWQLNLGWDSPISDTNILQNWEKFLSLLLEIANVSIPRKLVEDKKVVSISLHGFSDASQVAYGGCIYFVVIYSDHSRSSRLVAAKSRVNPLKKVLTVPKLELCAMELVSKLANRIVQIFSGLLQFDSLNLWSDSLVALSWIKHTASKFSPFVSRRVLIIQDNSSNFIWRHINTHLNPADSLSRGCFSEKSRMLWLNGPHFLIETNKFDTLDTFRMVESLPETRKVNLVGLLSQESFWNSILNKYSTFRRLQHVVAYLLRFVAKARRLSTEGGTLLSVKEQISGHDFIIGQIQKECFSEEIGLLRNKKPIKNKLLLPLNIFLDESGLLRVGGRLQYADLNYDQKHPLLLPSNHFVVSLLISQEHKRLGHSGPQNVLGNFRRRYWPLGGVRQVKKLLRKCVLCHRFNAQMGTQLMAPLPPDRVQISRPFSKCGVDFAGPIQTRSSHLKKSPLLKSYLAIFICMVTKAVHIEVVSDLSTQSFIAALKRFIGRRGNPHIIYSDNGTNFIGANNQLKELASFFRSHESFEHIQTFLSQNEISWKFIPARSPHWGGLWEAAVKSAKSHLVRLLGMSVFTYEQISTILIQIEAILNSRPLFPLSSNPNDLLPLTPGHFLIGAPLTAFPERDVCETPLNRLSFWEQCTRVQQNFWRKWSIDYLNQLQHRPKWTKPAENFKIGDLVLVKSEDRPPLNWPLARITEVLTGKDGKVRAVKLKTADGEYTRPIVKLAQLPLTN